MTSHVVWTGDDMNSGAKLICLCGKMAAGKSTLARDLAEREDAMLLVNRAPDQGSDSVGTAANERGGMLGSLTAATADQSSVIFPRTLERS